MIKLTTEIYTTIEEYDKKLGEFRIEVEDDDFVKPIPNSTLKFKDFEFFIDKILQDTINKKLIFYKRINLSKYTYERDLSAFIRIYERKGWKWFDVNLN